MDRPAAAGRRRRQTRAAQDDRSRAHRRGHQRFRRGRAALRPVARRDRRAHGQRHLDDRDHPGRDPAAGAQRRRRQRHPHPHRLRAGHQRRRRDRPRRRVQRAGAARPRAGRRAEGRRARSCSRACGASTATRRSSRRTPRRSQSLQESAASASIEVPLERECRTLVADPRRGKNMFVLGMLCQHLQPRPAARARPDRAARSARRTQKVIDTQRRGCSTPATPGPRRNLDFKYRIPAETVEPSRRSSSTATPRSRSACWPRGWTSARCTRSRRRRRRRTTCPTCSSTSAASCTRPRTRSPPARSRSAPRTPASAR